MEFVVENLSPTRKKIAFTLTADDVNAAINTAVKGFQKDLSLPGFRKGKVPASVVEKRFGEDVYARATQDEINGLLQKTLKDSSLTPVSSMEMDNHDAFARDTEFKCNVTFDVLPEIEFPNYEGLEVDQAKADVSDDDVNEIIENLRGRMAELTEVTEDRLPQDGDTVDVDYSGTDEEGNKIDDVQGENFGVALGQGQALPDFEALVKTAKVGEEKTGPVNFPADYPHKPLAGKTVIFTIKVNKIQTSQKPEVNEEFAQKVGQESLEKMKASIVEHVSATKAQAARSEAMKKLIDGLLEKVSFEIPDSMLNARVERVVQEQAMKLQRMGLDDLRKDQAQEEKREEAKKEALETLRPQVFLMALAQKENITVNDQEVEMAIYGMAMRAQQDYKKVSEVYHKSGLIYELRDRILADKALEMVYSKAKINEVPAVSLSEPKNAD